jgi:hypothetical protein
MALGSTQPVTQMSTRNLPGGKRRPAPKADKFTDNCEPIIWKMCKPRCLTTLGPPRPVTGIVLLIYIYSDMTPERRNSGVTETAVARKRDSAVRQISPSLKLL